MRPPGWCSVNTRDTLYLVCEQGEAAAIPVHAVPEAENPPDGVPLEKISALQREDRLAGLCLAAAPRESVLENWFVFTATRQGMVKKSCSSELPGPSANTFTLVQSQRGRPTGLVAHHQWAGGNPAAHHAGHGDPLQRR